MKLDRPLPGFDFSDEMRSPEQVQHQDEPAPGLACVSQPSPMPWRWLQPSQHEPASAHECFKLFVRDRYCLFVLHKYSIGYPSLREGASLAASPRTMNAVASSLDGTSPSKIQLKIR